MSLLDLCACYCSFLFKSDQVNRLLVCPVLYCDKELIKAVLLLILVIKLTAKLKEISEELYSE